MKDAACLPELFMTAIVEVGVGMGRFAGRSSRWVVDGGCTGENPKNGEESGKDVEGGCFNFRGGGSVFWSLGGLIASADLGSAEGMDDRRRQECLSEVLLRYPLQKFEDPLSLPRN